MQRPAIEARLTANNGTALTVLLLFEKMKRKVVFIFQVVFYDPPADNFEKRLKFLKINYSK